MAVGAAAPALGELRTEYFAAALAGPFRTGNFSLQDLLGTRRVGCPHPDLGLALGRRQLPHGGGQHLVPDHGVDAFGPQQVFRVVRRGQVERAEYALQSRIYRSNSASHLAAQMKSFSDSPPTAWVEYATLHRL